MTDLDFLEKAESVLRSIESGCDHINEKTEIDLDSQRVGNMLTLTFPNKSQIIINLQKPLQEIWMATKSGGYHYKFSEDIWLDTKTSREFFTDLSRDASRQADENLVFIADQV